jgi:hypothetical protein
MKSGSLNLLEPSGSVQACNGIALPLPLPYLGIFTSISNLNKTGVELYRMPKHLMWEFHILHSMRYNSVIYSSNQRMHSISLRHSTTATTRFKFKFTQFYVNVSVHREFYIHLSVHREFHVHVSVHREFYVHLSVHREFYVHVSVHREFYVHVSVHREFYVHVSLHREFYVNVSVHRELYVHVSVHRESICQ